MPKKQASVKEIQRVKSFIDAQYLTEARQMQYFREAMDHMLAVYTRYRPMEEIVKAAIQMLKLLVDYEYTIIYPTYQNPVLRNMVALKLTEYTNTILEPNNIPKVKESIRNKALRYISLVREKYGLVQ